LIHNGAGIGFFQGGGEGDGQGGEDLNRPHQSKRYERYGALISKMLSQRIRKDRGTKSFGTSPPAQPPNSSHTRTSRPRIGV
jgi:hypothetical protein